MGYYVVRVRMASFFAGASAAAFGTLLPSSRLQACSPIHLFSDEESLDGRISALEKMREIETSKIVEATD